METVECRHLEVEMKSFSITVEILGVESANSEIAEREIIQKLDGILEPGSYTVFVEESLDLDSLL